MSRLDPRRPVTVPRRGRLDSGPGAGRGGRVACLGAAAAVLAACSSGSGQPSPVASPPVAVPSTHVVTALTSRGVGRLGELVTDETGRTVYADSREVAPGRGCDAECRRTWPVLTASATTGPRATGAVQQALIGTATVGGQRVVTYAGRVVHLFVGDAGPSGAAGQGVEGTWTAVTVSGRPAAGAP